MTVRRPSPVLWLRPARGWAPASLGLAFALIAGCASVSDAPLPKHPDAAGACVALFERSDVLVAAAGTGDAGAARIDGFPWLRSNRLLASFRDELDTPERFSTWLAHLAELDRAARYHELSNLDADARAGLRASWAPEARRHVLPVEPETALDACRGVLKNRLQGDAERQSALRQAATVPDVYRDWQRVLGLYPLAWRVARPRVSALHERLGARFDVGLPAENARRYAVADRPRPTQALNVREATRRIDRDALGIPLPDADTRARLFDTYAPVWKVEQTSRADEPGRLVLDAAGRPVIDTDTPVEYRHPSWTRFGDDVLLQLNYTIWFPERPPESLIDIYAGHLDGVVWRVTLDAEGGVLAYDSMHTCGCYYTLLPGPDWQAVEPPRHEEPIFAPGTAPVPGPHERVLIGLERGTHYLTDVVLVGAGEAARRLDPLPSSALRSLPHPGGGTASAYASDGLIPVSRRLERFVFWPLGVPSAGASRQPGTHAVAFVGRRHFDDARLFERLLEPRDSRPTSGGAGEP